MYFGPGPSGLGFFGLDIRGKDHLFDPFAEVPVPDNLVTVVFVLDHHIDKTRSAEEFLQFRHGNRTGYSTTVGIFVFYDLFGEFTFF